MKNIDKIPDKFLWFVISFSRIDFIDISSESITFVFEITRIIADINQFASFFLRVLKAKNKLKTHEWQVCQSLYFYLFWK